MTEVEKKGIGKVNAGLVICAVSVFVLSTFSIWLFTDLQNQRNLNIDLQFQKDNLQNELSFLNMTYNGYVSTHSYNDSEYDLLLSRYYSYVADHLYSNSQYDNYVADHQHSNSQYDNYVADHSHNDSEYDLLQSEYEDYVADHQYTNSQYDEAFFYFYYVRPDEQEFGVYDLEDELYGLNWTKPYEEDVFDCSEMSACLEWRLENEGWNAKIVVGDSPFGSGYHAWLLVETSEGKYMPVEATTIEIVWWSDPYFDNYFTYDHKFETIQEAIAYYESEFDWWNSP